jgi:hypothetical protein
MHAFCSTASALGHVDVGRPTECDAWARIFDVSYRELIAAVKAVGADVENIHRHLQERAARATGLRRAASRDAC